MAETVKFVGPDQAWPIFLARDHPTARLAAEELQTYLRRISDRSLPIIEVAPGGESPCIETLYEEGKSDGFVRQVSADRIRLIGRSPRGLLCAVYDLLEELGCRWYYPGEQGERAPRQSVVGLPPGVKDEEPFLRSRGLILGHEQYLKEASAWIDWAGKNRLNYVFFHPFPPRSWGGRYEKAWHRIRREITPQLGRRGMAIEYGGHLLTDLLPRRTFLWQREAFRFDGRRRTADHNLCPSSLAAMRLIRQRARKFFLAHPEIDVFHLWPDDIAGGGWCSCPSCEHLSASDQALMVTNEIADVLSEVNPRALISFLAYHDTSVAPAAIKPRPNVALLYAPRERCYAHALDDTECALNRKYMSDLRSQAAWFRDSGWPELHVFEYYLDGILFKSMAPPLANLLPADLRAYRDSGCHHVGAIITADRPWITPPLNGFLFAKLAWNPDQDVDNLVRDYASGYYGGPADVLATYQQELELAFHLLLDLTPEETERNLVIRNVLDPPPMDALDFMNAPLEVRRAKLAALLEARKHLTKAGAHLEAASRPGAGWKPRGRVTRNEILSREQTSFRLASLQFDFLYQRQLAYCLMGEKAPRREIKAALRRAESALHAILDWGKRELRQERKWLYQFQLTHSLWRLHLWKVCHDALAWTPLGRLIWRWRALAARRHA